ncbi:MAG: putative sensor domain DACNV-containing protein, partial [Aureliella sp.]
MESFAFPNDLIGDVKNRWKAAPAVGEAGLPDAPVLQLLLEICYHASLRTTEHRPVHCVVAY